MVDGRAEDRVRDEMKRGKARGLGVRGGVTGVTRAVNIGRNEVSTRNKGRNVHATGVTKSDAGLRILDAGN